MSRALELGKKFGIVDNNFDDSGGVMAVKDVREIIESTAPGFALVVGGIAAILFFITMIPAFFIGAAWAGIRQGFIMGRDW